jgi:L-threonylcarbamoyladenylate synthase
MRMTAPYEHDDDVARAAALLRDGRLVAFPTETVYGLGADATSSAALRRLYAVKGRPASHPVIVHVGRAAQLDTIASDVPDPARALADACWPGPLTLVVRRRPGVVADEATGGRDTVGVRVPNHPLALALLDAFGGPVAAPSANRFGRVSPTTAAHVRADLDGDVDAVIDGGPCAVGVESTIVDVTGATPVVLRVGGVSEARVGEIVGASVTRVTDGSVAAPGTLAAHYSPNARVEVVVPEELEKRASMLRSEGKWVQILNAPPDTAEYARVLYASLREADVDGVDVILAVAPPDDGGMGTVVRDRLRRAAAR